MFTKLWEDLTLSNGQLTAKPPRDTGQSSATWIRPSQDVRMNENEAHVFFQTPFMLSAHMQPPEVHPEKSGTGHGTSLGAETQTRSRRKPGDEQTMQSSQDSSR